MTLTYVSLTERADVDLVQILAARSISPSAKQEVTGAGRMF
jgi:hypothetical protein